VYLHWEGETGSLDPKWNRRRTISRSVRMMLAVWHCFSTTTWTSAQKILQNVGNRIRESVYRYYCTDQPIPRGYRDLWDTLETNRAVGITFRKFILRDTEQKCALLRCVTRHRKSRDANTRVLPSAISRIESRWSRQNANELKLSRKEIHVVWHERCMMAV